MKVHWLPDINPSCKGIFNVLHRSREFKWFLSNKHLHLVSTHLTRKGEKNPATKTQDAVLRRFIPVATTSNLCHKYEYSLLLAMKIPQAFWKLLTGLAVRSERILLGILPFCKALKYPRTEAELAFADWQQTMIFQGRKQQLKQKM